MPNHPRHARAAVLALALALPLALTLPPDGALAATPSGNCLYALSASNGAYSVSNAAGTSAPLTISLNDPTNPTYKAKLGGKNLTVRFWLGIPTSVAVARTDAAVAEWDSLAANSVAEATNDEGLVWVTETPTPSRDLGPLEIHAAVVHDGTAGVDYMSIPEGALVDVNIDGLTCLRSNGTSAVTITTDTSSITLPAPADVIGISPAAIPDDTSVFQYRTFIPDAKADSGVICGMFKGDNRKFSNARSAASRTHFSLVFDWGNRKIVVNKAVEETKRLDSWYGPIHWTAATKRASEWHQDPRISVGWRHRPY